MAPPPRSAINRIEPWIRGQIPGESASGVLTTVETEIKYAGYMAQQERQIRQLEDAESRTIPNYASNTKAIPGLSNEVRQKLAARPAEPRSARHGASPALPLLP